MPPASTDVTDEELVIPKDESFAMPSAARVAGSRFENAIRLVGIVATVGLLHVGMLIILNRFDLSGVNIPREQEIPVELVTQVPPAEPKPQPEKPPQEDAAPKADPEKKIDTLDEKPSSPAEPPKVDTSKAELKTDPPATEPPKTEPPKTEPPKTEAEAPKAEPPKPEPPKTEPPQAELPKAEVPAAKPAQPASAPAPENPPKPVTEQPKSESQKAGLPKAAKADHSKNPLQHAAPSKAAPVAAAPPIPPPPALPPSQELPHQAADLAASPRATAISPPPQFSLSRDNFSVAALPESTADGEDPASYSMLVFSRLELAKKSLEPAYARGIHGSAGIGFTLDDKGSVLDAELLVPSGDADLDRESVALVYRAAPFPPPPAGAQHRFDAVVTFDPQADAQPN